jgi:hypothetical protein
VSVERLEAQVDGMPHDDWYEYINAEKPDEI